MTIILTITATTTDDAINNAIRYSDMRAHAIEIRDMAAAVLAEQGDQTVLEYHDVDGIDVLYSPTYGYALINEHTPGVGNSLIIDNGEANSAEHAAAAWRE